MEAPAIRLVVHFRNKLRCTYYNVKLAWNKDRSSQKFLGTYLLAESNYRVSQKSGYMVDFNIYVICFYFLSQEFPAWRSAFRGGCEELVVFLGNALNGTSPLLCGRQVAQFSLRRKGWWQEGHPTVKHTPCY